MSEAQAPVRHQSARLAADLTLDCGRVLARPTIAYRTYGTLNTARSNAVLVCHALTGDQYVAEPHPLTGRPGWWDTVVGPGLPIDTARFFVICSNVLGGCMGSTGPLSPDEHGRAHGPDFPPITIADMVRAQALLLDHLGIERLFACIGGSMGGMQVLAWMAHHPGRLFAAVPIATAAQHSAQNIAFNEVSRQAIAADPDFRDGRYAAAGVVPSRGLAVARMMAHITYLSEAALQRKFGRRVRRDDLERTLPATLFDDVFEVESYLRHQGSSFVQRFDANAYLTITRAMDWFDLAAEHDGDLAATFASVTARVCLVSFSSDWLFPTEEARSVARALNRAGVNVSFVEIETDRGHDAFLLDEPDFSRTLRGFLAGCAERAGLA